MPQLNPSPWLMVLLTGWLIFLTIVMPKILTYTFMNPPAPKNTGKSESFAWTWPWH